MHAEAEQGDSLRAVCITLGKLASGCKYDNCVCNLLESSQEILRATSHDSFVTTVVCAQVDDHKLVYAPHPSRNGEDTLIYPTSIAREIVQNHEEYGKRESRCDLAGLQRHVSRA